MTKRRRLILGLAIILAMAAMVGSLALFLMAPRHLTHEEFESQIRGKTLAEIETIMGRPSDEKGQWVWKNGNLVAVVNVDQSGKIIGYVFAEFPDNTIFGKIRRWLGL